MKRGQSKPAVHSCPACGKRYRYHHPFEKHLWGHDPEDQRSHRARMRLHTFDYDVTLSPFRLFVDAGDRGGACETFYTIDHDRRELTLSWAVPPPWRGIVLDAALCDVKAHVGRCGRLRVVHVRGTLYVVKVVDGHPRNGCCWLDHDLHRVVVSRSVPKQDVGALVSAVVRHADAF
jgi:hypothetical protein